MKAYLVHCALFPDRLQPSTNTLQNLCLDIEIVHTWDANSLDSLSISFGSQLRWENCIQSIAPVLLANAWLASQRYESFSYAFEQALDLFKNKISLPSWMSSRMLRPGEVSVLLKHFYAISSIANGNETHGLIAEDDILCHDLTFELFIKAMDHISSASVDYLDIAGGSGLVVDQNQIVSSDLLVRLDFPRTRTNACYIVSRDYARVLCESFFPLVFPVDWHIQYLFSLKPPYHCYWSSQSILVHGSELNHYKSWRQG